jgi:hypothetical protein
VASVVEGRIETMGMNVRGMTRRKFGGTKPDQPVMAENSHGGRALDLTLDHYAALASDCSSSLQRPSTALSPVQAPDCLLVPPQMPDMVSLAQPMQRQFNPYTDNGGTILAIAGADFSVIAGDTRQSEGYNIQTRYAPKVFRL